MGLFVQYGCGLCAPQEWVNFDVSPTLRAQKIPLIGSLITGGKVKFPDNVRYGNIVKGLPGIAPGSADGAYCSHVLEHLSLADCRTAIRNTYRILKPGGIFRLVVPDLEILTRGYLDHLEKGDPEAGIRFVQFTIMGETAPRGGMKDAIQKALSNADHKWMWDHPGMMNELKKAGFSKVRRAEFNDSSEKLYLLVEEEERFQNAVAIEAIK